MKIGIFGAGTVGGGVIEILEAQRALLTAQGLDIEITKCCVRDPKKYKGKLPKSVTLVTDINDILNDDSIDTVLEIMGGVGVAKDVVFGALKKGKNVVTANKALIAKHLPKIEAILAKNPQIHFCFEAAVGGGIPIIHSLQNDFLVDNVTQISGIFNGTTNYMLSKMEAEGCSYADVLKEAQDLGFAEADPTADVGGFDARAKIAILIKLAFGLNLDEENIYTQGMERISDVDFTYAHAFDSTIKLIAFAQKDHDEISAYVSPVLIKNDKALASINGVTNAVMINSEFQDETVLVGKGAGRFPTANSVVTDIVNIARGINPKAFPFDSKIVFEEGLSSQFYIRFQITEGIGIIRRISEACEKYGVSIHSISQLPIGSDDNLPFVLTTEKTTRSAVEHLVNEVEKADFCNERPFFMPIF